MTRAITSLLLLALTGLAACGGSGAPSDWKGADELGASFKLPPGLTAGAPKPTSDGSSVTWTGKEGVSVFLLQTKGNGSGFATLPGQQKAVFEAIQGGEVEGQESVDVDGADDAYRLKGTVKNTEGKTVKFSSLGMRKGQDTWVLTARAVEGSDVDPADVTGSASLG